MTDFVDECIEIVADHAGFRVRDYIYIKNVYQQIYMGWPDANTSSFRFSLEEAIKVRDTLSRAILHFGEGEIYE